MPFVVAISLVFGLLAALQWLRRWGGTDRFPPGPRALPFLGNVHQLPLEHQGKAFAKWGKKYGGLIYAKMFGTSVIVINSLQVARDLMDKRSHNYSGRPRFTLMVEMLGWDGIVLLDYNDKWKKQRKWVQEAFSKASLPSIRPILRRESCMVLSSIIRSPHLWKDHISRYSASIILDTVYGHQGTSGGDEFFQLAETASRLTSEAGSPGSMPVDFFPLLKNYPLWLPGSGFRANAIRVQGLVRELIEEPFNTVKEQLSAGTAKPSMVANLLEESFRKGTISDDEYDIKYAAGNLYGAGTETSNSVLQSFILAMVIHQNVFKKAQEELDRVVGQERLPEIHDQESLPYLKCVILELYRYLAPVPLGIPHKAGSDDYYRGYLIPKGSLILGNIWAMSHDETAYARPESFLPERFSNLGNSDEGILDPKQFVFGFGRRICPGRDLAEEAIFLLTARITATMNISRAKDENGKDIVPPFDLVRGFSSHPKPFRCVITPRSQKAISVVSRASLGE